MLFLAFVKIKLWVVNSANISREFEFPSSANPETGRITQSREERGTVIFLASLHVHQSALLGFISIDQISHAPNIKGFNHQWLHQYQCVAAEPEIAAPTPIDTNVSNSFIEDQVFTTDDSAVETIESARNIENFCRIPPPPYHNLVTKGDTAREVQSIMTNFSYSIQEPPPAYEVFSTGDSVLGRIQNVINTTYLNQEPLVAYQPFQAGGSRVGTNQNIADDTCRAQGPPPTYEESVTIFTESGAI